MLPRETTRVRGTSPSSRPRVLTPIATAAPVHAVRTRSSARTGARGGAGAVRAGATVAATPLNDLLEQQAARIAYTLHDDVAQDLALAHLRLAEIQPVLAHAARAAVRDVRAVLDRMEHRLRCLARELRPIALETNGLDAALAELARTAQARWGITITVRADAPRRLPAPVETALYRVVQEALANAGRHARATRARVRLSRSAGGVRCSITDDGTGLARTGNAPGVGLCAIEHRVAELGGIVRFLSPAAGGLVVVVTIPVEAPGGGARADRR
jgi:signal transduction histidine kinase